MNQARLRQILDDVRGGRIEVAAAADLLRHLPYEDLGFARVDHHRGLRHGFAEVVLCEGKSVEQVTAIMSRLADAGGPVLATRASPEMQAAVRAVIPQARWFAEARAIVIPDPDPPAPRPGILIVTAGTADLPVAHEARVTAETMGSAAELIADVGVAGVHRLLDQRDALTRARVVVVVAGMDGVLPSLVGGLVRTPVIAVPTSTGYGASFGGLAALLTMLNSCAPGVAVVNIDNGFGAGFLAATINRLGEAEP